MKKFFFFDIDGTLAVGTKKQIPADTKICLNLLRANGHFVAIATGRLQADAVKFAEELGIASFVADGGNSLTIGKKLINMTPLPRKNCLSFIEEVQRRGLPWAYTPENKIIRYTPTEEFIRIEKKSYFKTILQPIEPASIRCFYKMYLVLSSAQEQTLNWHGLPHFPYTENTYLIEPIDKAAGILAMVEKMGGCPEDVVVFGDGINDLKMFRPEWFSVAMGNGQPRLKSLANYVTDDCDKGGIYNACKKFNWI